MLEKTNRGLKDALLALLERKQFEQVSIREICAEAGIHYATFFRRHASKEDLLEKIASDQVEAVVTLTLSVLDSGDARASFVALFEYIDDHRALWTTLLTGGAAASMRATLMNLAAERSAQVDAPEGPIPRALARNACVTLIIEAITWQLAEPPGAYPPERMADIVGLLLKSCLKETTAR